MLDTITWSPSSRVLESRWCQYEPDANGPPSVLAIGLLDFLQDNQVRSLRVL